VFDRCSSVADILATNRLGMDANRTFWLRRAGREALRFNFGWWLQFFLPWLFGLGILGSVGVLGLRSANHGLFALFIVVLLMALAGVIVSFFFARPKFLSISEALARLDVDLSLHARLSSANEGIGEWPAPRAGARLALGWNWTSLLKPPLVAGALLAASVMVPLPKGQSKPTGAAANPPSWDAIQNRLDALENSEIVQADALERLQASLDSLRNQTADQWFGHGSLEASDQLHEQVEQSAGMLGEQLEVALGVLEAARSIEPHQSQTFAESLDNALDQTIQAMELGALPLNEQTLSLLRELDSSKVRQLSSEEWKSLSDKLKAGMTASPTGYPGAGKGREAVLASVLGQGSGSGDVGRGPGTAPLMLKADKTQLETTETEAVGNDDLSRAALGDLAGLSTGEPQVDTTIWRSGESGGANSSAGTGSETVWDQVATPTEQEALRRFFK
jgi:hypothetical protein